MPHRMETKMNPKLLTIPSAMVLALAANAVQAGPRWVSIQDEAQAQPVQSQGWFPGPRQGGCTACFVRGYRP